MKNIKYIMIIILFAIFCFPVKTLKCFAYSPNYYTVYSDNNENDVLFLIGGEIYDGDEYLSHDNKLYVIDRVDNKNKKAYAKFIKDEQLPVFDLTKNNDKSKAHAFSEKKIGLYHTHNDESYFTPDGVDSVYGKGGIHDVGKELSSQLNSLGIKTVYDETLHLPHNSGAYTRSQSTASRLISEGVDAVFDIHRDSTKRSEYLVNIDGEKMSSIRLVVGSASLNFEENKKFAYTIKACADKMYNGLIKDIFFGKGNYNQQLSTRAMLFEMGCENIEKAYVLSSTEKLAKVIDVVLYGTENANAKSLENISVGNNSESVLLGLVSSDENVNSNTTLTIILAILTVIAVLIIVLCIFSKKVRYSFGRFFSELFALRIIKRKKQ